MFWISVDKAVPAYNDQIVKVKVADFTKNYVTYGQFHHEKYCWYSIDGYELNDNVYAWKHTQEKEIKNLNNTKEIIENGKMA